MADPSPAVLAGGVAAALACGTAGLAACWLLAGRRGPRDLGRALLLWAPVVVLWTLFGWVAVERFTGGLARTTNLSDGFPWGIWVSFDILCGVATAAGGFLAAGGVHVFGARAFGPVLRPAILTAFLGYLLVVGGLFFDLGRPYNIWHPLVHWQPRSVLFEVGWCVSLYSTVLALEFLPLVLERLGWRNALSSLHRFTAPLVIAGCVLSTLHQSSLGALFLIVPHRLLPLWYTPLLPLLFLLTAASVGFAMIVVESALSSRAFGRAPEGSVHRAALRVLGPLCAVFLVLRLADVSVRGAWSSAFAHPLQGASFAAETLLLSAPVAVLLRPGWARGPRAPVAAAAAVVLGVVLNRLNVGWIGLLPSAGSSYVPSWQEVVVSLALLSVGVVLFGLAARYLPLFEHPGHDAEASRAPRPAAAPHPSARAR